jgi:hypothetical protein
MRLAGTILGKALVGVAMAAVMMAVLFAGTVAALKGIHVLWTATSAGISPLVPPVAIMLWWIVLVLMVDDEGGDL